MLTMSSLQQAGPGIGEWILYVILGLVVLVLIVWGLFQRVKKMEMDALSEAPASPRRKTRHDDLTRLEGIGPRVASVLKDAGVTNFEALSNADPAEIQNVLKAAGLQMMKPDGWIEQARLAAEGDWDGLQKLQEELKGGRRR